LNEKGAASTKSRFWEARQIWQRLSSLAADGEVIVSEITAAEAGLAIQGIESRNLDLKGIDHSVAIRVLRFVSTQDREAQ
jgi:class 3 adenylate cyclase